jgi:hypothetical protein
MKRRQFLKLTSAVGLQQIISPGASAQTGPRPAVNRIVFVHGIAQQNLDPNGLKATWIESLRRGATSAGLKVPDNLDIQLPYYGNVLYKFTSGVPTTADVQARGDDQADLDFLSFEAAAADQMRAKAGISDQTIDDLYSSNPQQGSDPQQRGPQNWRWVQAIVRSIDKFGFGISGSTIEAFLRDVYLYTNRAGVRDQIDGIVKAALTEEPTVVVAHSLGSVVAYNVLRTDTRKLHVPLLVTLGCPLAIRAVRDQLVPIGFPKPAVETWNNAFDPRDIVALNPLDAANFPVLPAVTNFNQVKNHTDNRHGIDGYLDDMTVARWILDALV